MVATLDGRRSDRLLSGIAVPARMRGQVPARDPGAVEPGGRLDSVEPDMNTAISRPDRHASTAAVAQRPALTALGRGCR